MIIFCKRIFPVLLFLVVPFVHAEPVVRDGEVILDREELIYSVEKWTPAMRAAAINDKGDRLELINMVLVNKKLAHASKGYVVEHPDLKQEYDAGIEAYQRDFLLRHFRDSLVYPNFDKLAKERYTLEKDKYALVPERRISSQILIASAPGQPRDAALAEAKDVVQQLRNGADFLEMVKEHSDEPRAVEKQGKFDHWVSYGEIGVEPRYSEGLFTIAKVGEYADPVQTRFGVHIIRLDGIKEKHYKTFDEVKGAIEKDLASEYQRLALKNYLAKFNMSDKVEIDDEAITEILAPYATDTEAKPNVKQAAGINSSAKGKVGSGKSGE